MQLAASLDELCYQFEQTASTRVLNSSKYTAQFKTQFSQELEALHTAAHSLHDQASSHHDSGRLTSHAGSLIRSWATCKARVTQCQPEHHSCSIKRWLRSNRIWSVCRSCSRGRVPPLAP